jgi:hypothetical protein
MLTSLSNRRCWGWKVTGLLEEWYQGRHYRQKVLCLPWQRSIILSKLWRAHASERSVPRHWEDVINRNFLFYFLFVQVVGTKWILARSGGTRPQRNWRLWLSQPWLRMNWGKGTLALTPWSRHEPRHGGERDCWPRSSPAGASLPMDHRLGFRRRWWPLPRQREAGLKRDTFAANNPFLLHVVVHVLQGVNKCYK